MIKSIHLKLMMGLSLVTGSTMGWTQKVPQKPSQLQSPSMSSTYLNHPFTKALISCYNTSLDLRNKAKEQYIQAEKVNQATSGWRPNLNATGSIGHTYNDSQAQNATNAKQTYYTSPKTGSVTLTQSLYAGGGTVAQTEQAEQAAFAGMSDFSKAEQEALVGAAEAFLTLWLKEATLGLRLKNVALKTATLEQVKARAGVGELTLTDIAQAESELASAMASKIAAEADVLTARATYTRIIGEAPTANLTPPRDFIKYFSLPSTKDGIIQQALRNHPAIQKAIYDTRSGRAGLDLARAQFLPTVDLSVQGRQGVQTTNPDSRGRSAAVTLNLKVPLYQAGNEYSKSREAQLNYKQSKVALSSVRSQIIETAIQVWEKWQSAKAQIEQTKVQIKAQALTLEGVRQEFMVGEKTTKDVLDAENRLVEAETALVNAEQTYFLATYQILSIMGQMTARNLNLPVELYHIAAHYEQTKNKWAGFGDALER